MNRKAFKSIFIIYIKCGGYKGGEDRLLAEKEGIKIRWLNFCHFLFWLL